MHKSFSQVEYEMNKSKYELALHKLQTENLQLSSENLRLSTKQLKRYWKYSIISFLIGAAVSIIVGVSIAKLTSEEKEKLESRIKALEQTVNRLEGSTRILEVLHTNEASTKR